MRNLAPAARGAAALTVPLLLGVWTGGTTLAVIAAVGALWGVGQDGGDPYWSRTRRLAWLGGFAALGLLAGELALRTGHGPVVTVALVAAGFVSGLVSPFGRVASVAGMHFLLGTVIGSGIPVPGPWWHAPLALLGGTLLVLVLSAFPWLWSRYEIERAAVRAVYATASRALETAGTPAAEDARRQVADALDHAHAVMAPHLARGSRSGPQTPAGRLVRAFHLAVPLGEAVTTLLWEGRALTEAVTSAPLRMEQRLFARGDHPLAPTPHFAPGSPGEQALADVCVASGAGPVPDVPLQPPARSWSTRAAHLRYALLLALCVLIAQLAALALEGPRGYWLPMTVAFVYKPDFGPVFRRSLHRCLGTVAGVAAIGAITLVTDDRYALIAAVAGFGAVMAVGVRQHYAIATTGLTGVVFVLLDMLGDHRALYWPRILDTALAVLVVLAVHFLLWPRSAADRAQARTADAVAAAQRYRDLAPGAVPAQRHALRRAAYQHLGEARRAAGQVRQEPSRGGRPTPDWEQAITEAEQLCDAVTAQAVKQKT
ncbi:FUSC family protein [Kineosporia sp. NBRC 101731]|uniref:FUSC family protein n=1 Tax=Kineosporia sp. NBRC 101731 TaxID=3032199 RepID=UPI0024A2EE5A|nr:FUSC family protein [Kineosporia sp. NBRC 101731]GLY31009.1 FUSC family protein [Kineosporia sp. NBRC 101731]